MVRPISHGICPLNLVTEWCRHYTVPSGQATIPLAVARAFFFVFCFFLAPFLVCHDNTWRKCNDSKERFFQETCLERLPGRRKALTDWNSQAKSHCFFTPAGGCSAKPLLLSGGRGPSHFAGQGWFLSLPALAIQADSRLAVIPAWMIWADHRDIAQGIGDRSCETGWDGSGPRLG